MLDTVYKFKNETGRAGLGLPHQIQQADDVWAAGEELQNLDFTADFFTANRFEDLDDAAMTSFNVDPSKDLRVLASADPLGDLVVVLGAPVDGQGLVVPVGWGSIGVHVSVGSPCHGAWVGQGIGSGGCGLALVSFPQLHQSLNLSLDIGCGTINTAGIQNGAVADIQHVWTRGILWDDALEHRHEE